MSSIQTLAMELCRACLATGSGMVPMDETFITNYNIVTSLDIKYSDDVPLHICKMCFNSTNYCLEFREKCIASDQYFRAILNVDAKVENIKLENEETDVKTEVEEKTEECDLIEDYFDSADYLELLPETDVIERRKSSRLNEKLSSWAICTTDNSRNKTNTIGKKLTNSDGNTDIKPEKLDFDDDGAIHCGLCTKCFQEDASLTKHLESHYSDIECNQCQESYYNLPHLLSHRMIHLPKDQKKCHICSKKFITTTSLEFHYMRVHEMAEKNAPINCKLCYASFRTSRMLGKHLASLHAEIKYRCNYCDKGFCIKSKLRVHMGKHKMVKYECDKCDFYCNFRTGLNAHILRRHTETKVICKPCKRPFRDQKGFDQHVCKLKSIICPTCGKEFKGHEMMNRHLKTHSDSNWYKCDQCPSKYKYKTSYNSHMDKHAGKPRYHCKVCQRSFYSGSVLTKHRRIHTGEKPYVCTICSKGFTGKNNLKVHMKVHGMHLVIKKCNSSDKDADLQLTTEKESKNSAARILNK